MLTPKNELYQSSRIHIQSNPDLLSEAAKIGWTQNVVILEQCETEEERRWYIQAVQQFGWSKQQLIKEIVDSAHTTR